MNSIYQHYILDLSANNNFVQIPTIQGDGNNIRGFEIELVQHGMKYEIDRDDTLVSIMGTKPDTCQVMNPCTINDEGYILVDITSQMSAAKGRGDYQIVLMSRSTNSQLKSFPFHILTTSAAFDIDRIVSSDEFQTLTGNIARTEEVIDDANDAISDMRELESLVEAAEKDRDEAEKSRVDYENDRVTAESARISAEDSRTAEEANRQSAESGRQSAETGRQSAEGERIDAENGRITAEAARVSEENNRIANEGDRIDAESTRMSNENARMCSESQRADAEDVRVTDENARKTAESARVSNESQRTEAENARISQESARQSNESIRQTNETKRQEDTTKAINRANLAAKSCEDIIEGNKMIGQVEIVSSTEPDAGIQNIGDFWMQPYNEEEEIE